MHSFRSGSRIRLLAAAAAFLLAVASNPARSAQLVPADPDPARPVAQAEDAGPGQRTPPGSAKATPGPRRSSRRPGEFLRWIVASQGEEVELVDIDEVRFFKSDNKYTRVATRDRDLLIRKSIKELAATLDPDAFWQVHRSTIVNVAMVASVCHGADGKLLVHLRDRRERLPVSRAYALRFHRM